MTRPGDTYKVPVGDYLGEMTDEIAAAHPDGRLEEFVSTGCKSYAYRGTEADGSPFTDLKCKGFSIDFKTAQTISMDAMIKMIQDYEGVTVEGIRQIRRTRDLKVVTRTLDKEFKVTFDKRFLGANHVSFPYGYK